MFSDGVVKEGEVGATESPANLPDVPINGANRVASTTRRQTGPEIMLAEGNPIVPEDSSSRRAQLVIKRVMDILVSSAALIALAPLLLFVAIAVKVTSPGPVLFRQEREGHRGRRFLALKFRSMWTHAGDESGVMQTVEGDKRITPLGRFLRRTSIDELPQLFNVLAGDMSLVGPRPHVPGMMAAGRLYRDLVHYYDCRLEMMPGLTGWAQANGFRGPTGEAAMARGRIDYDVAYIQNFSVLLDIKIILMTIRSEFISGSGS